MDATLNSGQSGPPDATTQFARFKLFVRRTLRFWWIAVITLLLGAVACAIFFLVRTPRYLSETVILFSEGIPATGEPRAPPDQNAAIRLRETLYSRPRLEAIIQKFDLYPEIRQRYGMVDAVDEFREDIGFRAPGSDTYTISYKGTSPEQAQNVTETLADSLIEKESNMRRIKARKARNFLATERKRTEKELKQAEAGLAEFLANHPSFALDSMLLMPGAPPTGAAIRAHEAEQSSSSTPSAGGGVRYFRPRSSGVAAAVDPGFHVPSELAAERTRAQAAVAAAQTDLSQKMARFTDHHPDVQASRATLMRAEQRLQSINAAIASASANAQSQAAALRAARQAEPAPKPVAVARRAPAKPADTTEKKLGPEELVELETQWSRLTRDVSEARSRHEQIETSFFKADINANSADGGNTVQMMVVDPAYLPLKTIPPGPITWVGIFMVLSMMLGSGLAVGRAAVDDRVLHSLDLADLAPVLTEVSRPTSRLVNRRRSHD